MTDVIMPGMNGRVLAEQMALARPGLRVLYTSGCTADVIASHGVLPEGTEFIEKPYAPEVLARRLREALGGSRQTP